MTMRGERIVSVSPRPTADCIDLGNVAIVPGLINAHTHLEFSDCRQPLGQSGMPLPDWLRMVIAARRDAGGNTSAAIAAGLAESLRAGTTTLGEIATDGWTAESLATAPLDLVAFYELRGLLAERVPERLAAAEYLVELAAAARHDHTDWHAGLSPHAPYSVHPELLVGLVRLANERRLPVAMHLAESREELELLAAGSGPFRSFLEELGVWEPTAFSHGTLPLAYLQVLAAAPRALVIHGNYLSDIELEYLAVHSERMSLVYCPRTHAYFGHDRHPLPRLMALGAAVALGTDSRASNPDLSMLAEMRHVARTFPEIAPADVLWLGTAAGAHALGRDADVGTLETGKLANLAVIELPHHDAADPHELLFDATLPVVATFYRGARITGGSS
ncbi:MAG TPA: amidohydrolase family protein [Pirellulales bacterium]|jgi:cytosine/adenosine deaminase-related metal-dependent hydrolase